MNYPQQAISPSVIPQSPVALLQHLIDTYAGETNKTASVWRSFTESDLDFRPHPKSMTVGELFRHQLLSERHFFLESLAAPEPPRADILPSIINPETCARKLTQLATRRLAFLAGQEEPWWLEQVNFFDARRERIWIFWRAVLHAAHHRTQLTVYLRLLNRTVPPVYGPTADLPAA